MDSRQEGQPLVRILEQELLSKSVSTARSFDALISDKVIELPQEGHGATILDIGGGGSDTTARLLENGFDAYALDPRYKSRSDIKGIVLKYMRELESVYGKFPEWKQHIQLQRSAVERFIESAKNNPDNYRVGFASQIPFPDDFFDHVLSINTITEYLDIYPETLFPAVSEAIRVTAPGGEIQLFPWLVASNIELIPSANQRKVKNQAQLLRNLSENPAVSYTLYDVENSLNKRLSIQKTA